MDTMGTIELASLWPQLHDIRLQHVHGLQLARAAPCSAMSPPCARQAAPHLLQCQACMQIQECRQLSACK